MQWTVSPGCGTRAAPLTQPGLTEGSIWRSAFRSRLALLLATSCPPTRAGAPPGARPRPLAEAPRLTRTPAARHRQRQRLRATAARSEERETGEPDPNLAHKRPPGQPREATAPLQVVAPPLLAAMPAGRGAARRPTGDRPDHDIAADGGGPGRRGASRAGSHRTHRTPHRRPTPHILAQPRNVCAVRRPALSRSKKPGHCITTTYEYAPIWNAVCTYSRAQFGCAATGTPGRAPRKGRTVAEAGGRSPFLGPSRRKPARRASSFRVRGAQQDDGGACGGQRRSAARRRLALPRPRQVVNVRRAGGAAQSRGLRA